MCRGQTSERTKTSFHYPKSSDDRDLVSRPMHCATSHELFPLSRSSSRDGSSCKSTHQEIGKPTCSGPKYCPHPWKPTHRASFQPRKRTPRGDPTRLQIPDLLALRPCCAVLLWRHLRHRS